MSDKLKAAGPPIDSELDLHAEHNRLRDRIAKFEAYMSSLLWKSETIIQLRNSLSKALIFERADSGWRLYVYDITDEGYENATLVKDSSLEVQSEVARQLPKLMNVMRAQFDTKAEAVKAGHAALDELEKQLPINALSETGFLGIRPTPVGKAGKAGS